MPEQPALPCEPPLPAIIGDIWFCPGCARKFYYIFLAEEDEEAYELWYTNEE